MIRINLLPREERQAKRNIALPKLGALMPVFALLFVALLFAAFALIQTMQVGRLKTDIATELCAVLAWSAIRNQDKVGLILFTDHIEKFLPPQKGRRHVLRVIREVLYFQPERRR